MQESETNEDMFDNNNMLSKTTTNVAAEPELPKKVGASRQSPTNNQD